MILFYIVLAIILFLVADHLFCVIINKSTYTPPESNPIKSKPTKSNLTSSTSLKSPLFRRPYLHKIKDYGEDDNMNFDEYVFSAKYSKTNRIHKNKSLVVMDGESVESCISALGYEEPISYEKVEFPSSDYWQKDKYFHLTKSPLPKHISYFDAEALIERYKYDYEIGGKDTYSPHPDLVEYATKMKMQFSYYIGKKHLYQLIFNSLNVIDKIAFYVFCVYKDLMQKKDVSISRNPKSCKHYNDFVEFAKSKSTDIAFMDSLSKIEGYTLRFFGDYDYLGKTLKGASTETVAYKETYDFLKNKAIL